MIIILEMANNHQGDLELGKCIISAHRQITQKFSRFTYAVKFQYRHLKSFIHPASDPNHKYVKRFRETNLKSHQRIALKEHAEKLGFKTVCTPFDEVSVDHVIQHGYDYIKVGSPSISDWPLWDKILKYGNRPIIASVGGATQEEVDRIVGMCAGRDLTLMHCVSEYPADLVNLNLGQIQWLKKRYPKLKVGYSSHETFASDGIDIAVILGARVIERHVCLDPKPNEYSLTPTELEWELKCLYEVHQMVGPFNTRVPGPKPVQFMRRDVDGDGRMWWKP